MHVSFFVTCRMVFERTTRLSSLCHPFHLQHHLSSMLCYVLASFFYDIFFNRYCTLRSAFDVVEYVGLVPRCFTFDFFYLLSCSLSLSHTHAQAHTYAQAHTPFLRPTLYREFFFTRVSDLFKSTKQ